MLSKEELLRPRYLVTAKYPKAKYSVGTLLIRIPKATNDYYYDGNVENSWLGDLQISELQDCPRVFQLLEWHEERQLDAMPEYLKVESLSAGFTGVFAVKWRYNGIVLELMGRDWTHEYWHTLSRYKSARPATLEEYDAYQQSLAGQSAEKSES